MLPDCISQQRYERLTRKEAAWRRLRNLEIEMHGLLRQRLTLAQKTAEARREYEAAKKQEKRP